LLQESVLFALSDIDMSGISTKPKPLPRSVNPVTTGFIRPTLNLIASQSDIGGKVRKVDLWM